MGFFSKNLLIAPLITTLTILISFTGLFQLFELDILDRFFRWRSREAKDPYITVVTLAESDIANLGHWPLTDQELVKLITNLQEKEPGVIGLDLYRDIPIEPGHQELLQIYQNSPNLIGVEKIIGEQVAAPPILKELEQVGFSDTILDIDGKLRRNLLSIIAQEKIQFSLGTLISLIYLEDKEIYLEPVANKADHYRLGQTKFIPLTSNAGGYVRMSQGGYQILLNFRGKMDTFTTIPLTDVLNGNFDASLIHNRIVLIGAVAESLKDFVQTPYDTHINGYAAQTPGVIVHANIASQIVNAALNGRPLLRVLPEPLEWLWILAWSVIGVFIGFTFLQVQLFKRSGLPKIVVVVIYTSISISTLILSSYAAFLLGWWTTAIAPATALMFSGLAVMLNNNRQLEELAFIDGLTRVANRRYFDRYLAEEWELGKRQTQQQISLILCDVDYFKFYNDHYGHQAGDRCLQQVAQAIAKATRKSDLVARYGGEEFVVILPKTNQENATHVAERMLQQVISLNIPHAKSQVKNCITVSCGVASVKVSPAYNPKDLIAAADQALYTAKKQGRASYWAVSLNS